MPNNIKGRGLTEREMVQLCLELEKGRCRSISHTLLETSHGELREIYQHCFQTATENQYALFEIMQNKGWYQTDIATPAEIAKVQAFMQNNLNPSNPE
ncbi:spore coat protein CotF [Cytobacillus horneckiae]|uniref:Spore coat protein n=1 Tax=Cytobacillus horneckiae TaxID=549687 RepID=A0A2N0ZEK9_9BACI|nr:spore coat protein [Cytobacillus horneckiae]NRG44703.1 spore coat protein [Bacillus sp. CRN 9]MBN6888081.1 spore coat protein [Cytobacillus horneckiae]MCM3176936.1 spore coat protein [Cytobacillus horneckiae]MEC1154636.1 spore coat protein [Cytobacillus horneckiae]MED2938977.1 spore coat protein [Cytobacillus horneckiae]